MSESLQPANLTYPNKLGRLYLLALQDVLRHSGYVALMNWVGMAQYARALPADNWRREVDFSVLARSDAGLSERYGPRSGRRLALRTGQRFFELGLKELGVFSGMGEVALRALPTHTTLKLGLNALASVFNRTSDQHSSVAEQSSHLVFTVQPCPICWEREAREPICYFIVGLLQEAAGWLGAGHPFLVREALCMAQGDDVCAFQIDKDSPG
ncbi:MAG: V4R domain-containing protein [Candidatus Promineifilaceae bacterium]|jgi:V4R domain